MADFPIEVVGFILFFLLSLVSSVINKRREQQREAAELAEASRRQEQTSETYRTVEEDEGWLEEDDDDRFKPVTETGWEPGYGLEPLVETRQEEQVARREQEALREYERNQRAREREIREQSLLAAQRLQQAEQRARLSLESEGEITHEMESVFPVEMEGEIGDLHEVQQENSVRQFLFESVQDPHSARKAFLLSEVFGPAMGIREQMGPRDRLWDR